MLGKHRDLGSLPDGLMLTAEDLHKGMLVEREKQADGTFKIKKATSDAKAYGFVTLRDDEHEHAFGTADGTVYDMYDVIKANTRACVYTLVDNNSWKTDQFTGEVAFGDIVKVEDGKLVKDAAGTTGRFEVIEVNGAMNSWIAPTIVVRVLPLPASTGGA